VAPPWSPAQFVALAFGALFLILGAATLATTGINADDFTSRHVSALGFHHTPLLGAIELGFGLLLIMAGAIPGAGRNTMVLLGALALGFGIVVLIQAPSLHDSLGVHEANGWLYIVTGVVNLAAAISAPVIFAGEHHAIETEDADVRTSRY
jgi:hypothetical protein